MFSSEVSLRPDANRRAVPRKASSYDTMLGGASGAARSPCRIIDISVGGARLRLYTDIAPETQVRIVLPGRGAVDAHIIWANGREAGCRFDTPLDETIVAGLMKSDAA